MTTPLIDRLKGNGEPWTFEEIIEHLEDLDMHIAILSEVRAALGTPDGQSVTHHAKNLFSAVTKMTEEIAFIKASKRITDA